MFPSKFRKFNIILANQNPSDINKTLSLAKAKYPHSLEITLSIYGQILSAKRQEFLSNHNENITSLAMGISPTDTFLLHYELPNLESLNIKCPNKFGFEKGLNDVMENLTNICETVIARHAWHLKHLRIDGPGRSLVDPAITSLPVLESLIIYKMQVRNALSVLDLCRFTITNLQIMLWYNIHKVSLEPADYELPRLTNLSIQFGELHSYLGFIIHNAANLESLYLKNIVYEQDSEIGFDIEIVVDIEWPKFPKLKQLNLSKSDPKLMSLLPQCKDSLECLVITGDTLDDPYHDLELPKLTDLYLVNVTCKSGVERLLFENKDSLKHVCLFYSSNFVGFSQLLVDDILPNVETVIIGRGSSLNYIEYPRPLSRLCPHAVIHIPKNKTELQQLIKTRGKGRYQDPFLRNLLKLFSISEEEKKSSKRIRLQ